MVMGENKLSETNNQKRRRRLCRNLPRDFICQLVLCLDMAIWLSAWQWDMTESDVCNYCFASFRGNCSPSTSIVFLSLKVGTLMWP